MNGLLELSGHHPCIMRFIPVALPAVRWNLGMALWQRLCVSMPAVEPASHSEARTPTKSWGYPGPSNSNRGSGSGIHSLKSCIAIHCHMLINHGAVPPTSSRPRTWQMVSWCLPGAGCHQPWNQLTMIRIQSANTAYIAVCSEWIMDVKQLTRSLNNHTIHTIDLGAIVIPLTEQSTCLGVHLSFFPVCPHLHHWTLGQRYEQFNKNKWIWPILVMIVSYNYCYL